MHIKIYLFSFLFFVIALGCSSDDRQNSKIPPNFVDSPNKRNQVALEFLSTAIRSNPAVPENYFKRALIYLKFSKTNLALEDIDEALNLKPNFGKYFYAKSLIVKEMKNFKSAYLLALQSEKFEFKTPELYILLAELSLQNDDLKKTDSYLAKSLQETPYNGDAYFFKSLFEAKKTDTLAAIEFMKKSIELKPRNLIAHLNISKFYNQISNFEESKLALIKAKKYFGDDINLSKSLVEFFEKRGYLDSAFAVNENILVKYPNDIQSLAKGVYIYSKWRNYFKSIEYCTRLIEIDPKNADYLYLMGTLNEGIGRRLLAEENYDAAINLKPGFVSAIERLANLRYSINQELGIGTTTKSLPKTNEIPVYEEVKKRLDTNRIKVNVIAPKAKIKIKLDSNRFKNN